MVCLPTDPMMLASVINMRLRDEYDDLPSLCDDLQLSEQELREKLARIGLEYVEDCRQFR